MLVLTRKQNEQIRIGNEITVTVIRTKGKAVRLGIEAPGHISVLRGELVFDSEEETTEPVGNSVQEKQPKAAGPRQRNNSRQAAIRTAEPRREPVCRAAEQASPKGAEAHWPTSQERSTVVESMLDTATVSAVTMRKFMDARVGI